MVGYRNEVAFDGGEHTPLEILKFETVDLGNAWLLEQIPVRFSSKLQDDIHEFVIYMPVLTNLLVKGLLFFCQYRLKRIILNLTSYYLNID